MIFAHTCRTCKSGFKYKALIKGSFMAETNFKESIEKVRENAQEIIDAHTNINRGIK